MKILVLFILLAFGFQQVPNPDNGCGYGNGNNIPTPTPISASEIRFHESQIRKADSLYKNYLPQSNFEEVKAAMEFFDSLNSCQSSAVSHHQSKFIKLHGLKPNLIDTLTYRLINFNCAKAHYYHAVGLTEKDDIVGACEHYLIALEIMEDMMAKDQSLWKKDKRLKAKVDNPEDYEKIRFIALIYTRLGRLFYDESFCDLAILKYRKALEYIELLEEYNSKANIFKCLGNTYQLLNQPDSALYYYNQSLKTTNDINNNIDIEKNIAQILYNINKKDSAYILMNTNLNKIKSPILKDTYCCILGEMYYQDKEYQTSINCFMECINSINVNIKLASSIKLSAIYDSIGDYETKAYYDRIVSELSIKKINKNVERSKLQYIYDKYKERKVEKEKTKNRKNVFIIIMLLICSGAFIFILIKYRYKIEYNELTHKINSKDEYIKHIKESIEYKEERLQKLIFKNSYTEGKIKIRNAEIQKKDKIIEGYEIEIKELRYKLEKSETNISNLNNYLQSKVCCKILSEINDLHSRNLDTSLLSPLKQDEFVVLLNNANFYLNNFLSILADKHPKLKKEDLYYICLVIIGLNGKQISSLFGVSYTAIRKRKNKINIIMGLDIKENLYKHIIKFI